MSRAPSYTVRDVERAYGRAKVFLPKMRELRRDPLTKAWFVGNFQVGKTAPLAMAYFAGVLDGARASAFDQAFRSGVEAGQARAS